MYNYGYERQKYLKQKEKEEKLLRLLGFPEWKIQLLRELDDYDFNKNRSFYRNENPADSFFFLRIPVQNSISEFTWNDLLDDASDHVIRYHLMKADPVLKRIILMLGNDYSINEIAKELDMTPNAVYKRIDKFRQKIKNVG